MFQGFLVRHPVLGLLVVRVLQMFLGFLGVHRVQVVLVVQALQAVLVVQAVRERCGPVRVLQVVRAVRRCRWVRVVLVGRGLQELLVVRWVLVLLGLLGFLGVPLVRAVLVIQRVLLGIRSRNPQGEGQRGRWVHRVQGLLGLQVVRRFQVLRLVQGFLLVQLVPFHKSSIGTSASSHEPQPCGKTRSRRI